MNASFEVLEHTAEVKLRVRGPSLGALAAEAGRALARIELGDAAPPASGGWRRVELKSRDRDALLVDWLNELIYLAEAERWVGVEFLVDSASDTALTMLARGVPVAEAPARVKAATFHGLHVADRPDGLEAEIFGVPSSGRVSRRSCASCPRWARRWSSQAREEGPLVEPEGSARWHTSR